MISEIGETIKVMAIFDKDIRPVKFKWHGRTYRVSEVTHSWQSRTGQSTFTHFSVTSAESSGTLYELSYNSSTMRWRLERIDG